MQYKYYIKIGILILVLGVVTLSGCVQNPQNQSTLNQTQNQSNATKYAVKAQNFTFIPNNLTVPVGSIVTWTNQQNGVIHRIYSDTGAFKSNNLTVGESYSFRFTRVGIYKYHCSIHPKMTGTILVK